MKHIKHKWKLGLIEQMLFTDVSQLVDMRNSEKLTNHIYDYMEDDDSSIIAKNSNPEQIEKYTYQKLGLNLMKQNYKLILYLEILSLIKDILYVFIFCKKIINLYVLDQLSITLKNLNNHNKGTFLTYILCIILQQLLCSFINAQLNLNLSNLKSRFYEQTTILVLQKQLKIYLYQTSNIDPIVLLSDDIGQIYEIFEILRKSFSGLLTFVFSFIYLKQIDENIWQTISLIILIAQIYNFTLCYYYIKAERKYKSQKEIRTQLMSQILNGIKQIKLLNWEKVFEQKIMNIRKLEFRELAYMKVLDGFGSVFWNNLTYLLLASYLVNQFSKGLNFEDLNIIPIITMFNTLNFPLGILPWNINNLLVGKISYDRIVQFLQSQEVIARKLQQSEAAITVNQFDFGWFKDKLSILINKLQLKSKTSIGVVGAIGSGKTTFIKSLLNEIQISPNQTSLVNGRLAYCPQTPWLINDSIRNNILFGIEYEEQFYNQVLDMCQIVEDINTFQERDQRQVGLNGSQMSGGQKQRIVLARGIYQNADIYIFDDPLSSCDFEVSKLIVQKAFGYLNQKQKTIIISSNHGKLFEQINFDRILLIEDGQLKDQQIKQFPVQMDNNSEIQNVIQDVDNKDTLDQDEDTEIKISLQTWITWFSKMGWLILIMFTIANFMMQVCFSYIDFWLKYKMEKQHQNNDSFNFQIAMQLSNTQAIIFLIALSLIITAIRGLFYALISITSGWYSFKKLNNSLMNSKLEFYENTQTGSILSRTSVDTYVIDTELSGRFHVFYEDISKVSGMLFGLLYLFPNVWIILAYAIYSSFRLSKKFSGFNTKLNNLCSEFQDQLLTQFNEIIQGTESIRVFEKQKHFQTIFLLKLSKYLQINSLQSRSQCWFQLRINLISNFLVAIIMAYLYFLESENVSQGQIILCITYSLGLFDNLNQIFTFYIDFQGLLISFERVRQFYFIKQENLGIFNEKSQIKDSNQNILSFQNVCLEYNDKQVVLKNISFEIKQNQKIVIIGRTGSGKTSILNVLFRLYDYNSGQVKLNGVDIKQINLSDLRSRISIIPQSGFLYEGTLLENLNPKNKLEQQQVISFLSKIKQQFNNLSTSLTDPYYQIQPNGDNLSTGEKQILNIFRALLQDSEIICLDEAQSSIDSETNKIINKIFNELTKNKTVITISHNLENLEEYDMIITMSYGEIQQVRYKNS